jgi:acetyl-CoA C-acetyltransferase
MDYIDLYSCFPSVVQIACDELGLAHDDPRGLTITGGLPYFGGAGNCYVMCSIAEMMNRLRAKPGSKAFITGNGWYVTKHSIGVYSTSPYQGKWSRQDPKDAQAVIDAQDHPVAEDKPNGTGTVEAYTIIHARKKIRMGIILGRLENGNRFVAHLPLDEAELARWEQEELVGKTGTVTAGKPTNLFVPD